MSEIFVGNNGHDFLAGRPDTFSKFFDWQVTLSGIYGNTQTPKTIYIKTDFLPVFVSNILPNLREEFLLITSCSDYSPEINFPNEYHAIFNHPLLKFWFMQNMKTKTEKTFSLPTGLGSRHFLDDTPREEVDQILLDVRNSVESEDKIDKVFCCFRERDINICGEDQVIRPKIKKLIEGRTDIFDFYEPTMSFPEFVKTISKYKYALCPHGNGMDPSPLAWVSLIVKTIPVCYRTPNASCQYEGTDSVIFFDKLEEILNKEIYKPKPPIEFEFLTYKYWVDKINSKIKYIYKEGEPHKHIITEFDSTEMAEILNKRGLLHLGHGSTDKIIAHSYTGVYEKWMKPIQNENLRMLEIGSFTGGSLVLWHDYFPNLIIDSMDIWDGRSEESKNLDRVTFFQRDAYNQESLEMIESHNPDGYDLIIDDGPHTIESQIYCVSNYLGFLKKGGCMFIEDLQEFGDFEKLIESIPVELRTDVEVFKYDLRKYKNRYDDLMIVIKKKL